MLKNRSALVKAEMHAFRFKHLKTIRLAAQLNEMLQIRKAEESMKTGRTFLIKTEECNCK